MTFQYSVKSEKTVDDVVMILTKNLKDVGFGILGTLDFQKIFQIKGLEYDREYKLLEVCNPVAAKTVLDSNPELGLMLPCTIAVYDDNGKTVISLAKPTFILSITSDDSFKQLGIDIESKLIQAIEKTK